MSEIDLIKGMKVKGVQVFYTRAVAGQHQQEQSSAHDEGRRQQIKTAIPERYASAPQMRIKRRMQCAKLSGEVSALA